MFACKTLKSNPEANHYDWGLVLAVLASFLAFVLGNAKSVEASAIKPVYIYRDKASILRGSLHVRCASSPRAACKNMTQPRPIK